VEVFHHAFTFVPLVQKATGHSTNVPQAGSFSVVHNLRLPKIYAAHYTVLLISFGFCFAQVRELLSLLARVKRAPNRDQWQAATGA